MNYDDVGAPNPGVRFLGPATYYAADNYTEIAIQVQSGMPEPPDPNGFVMRVFTGAVTPGAEGCVDVELPPPSTSSPRSEVDTPNPYRKNAACNTEKPVNCATGNFWHTFEDLSLPGRGVPLNFTRTYSAAELYTPGPLGPGWTHSYDMSLSRDAAGNATVRSQNGSTVSFTYLPTGAYVAPPKVLATLVRNPVSPSTYTFVGYDEQVSYLFNPQGQLVEQRDRNGYLTTLAYSAGLLATVTDPAGRTLTFSYTSGKLSEVADSTGRSVGFTYDASGDLDTATDVAGGVSRFGYDALHRMVVMKDARCSATSGCPGVGNVYDYYGRVSTQTDNLGRTTAFSYGGATTTITDPEGNRTVHVYEDGKLVSLTKGFATAQPATWSFTYDPATLGRSRVTDPNGHTTTSTFDERGNQLTGTDALGRTTTTTYNADNQPTTITDPSGVTTTFTYDGAGNLLSRSRPLVGTSSSALTTFAYADAAHPGDVTSYTDANGEVWSYTYNANGDRTSSADPLANVSTTCYNARGQVVSMTTPSGSNPSCAPGAAHTTYRVNNAFGDPTSITDPLSHTTTFGYDATRNPTTVTDALSHTTTSTYDLEGQLTQRTRHDGTTSTTSYDGNANVVARTDALAHTTTYAYDALDRPIATTDALNRRTTATYDPAGNPVAVTDASGQVTALAYDAADQLTARSYSDPLTPDEVFSYDPLGRRVAMGDGSGTTTSTYDSLGRLTATTDGSGHRVGYGYDLVGHPVSITYPGQVGQPTRTVTRTYDGAGRLTEVADWLSNRVVFGYDADANLTTQTAKASGVTVATDTWTFDGADRAMGVVATTPSAGSVHSITYGRDAADRLSAEGATAFGYDTVDRLSSEASATIGYDDADRITSLRGATQSYDVADQLGAVGATGVSHDARGNRTAMGVTTYAYDAANRLTRAGTAAAYSYNGDGLRTAKAPLLAAGLPGPPSTSYTWGLAQPLPLLLQESVGAAAPTTYLYGPGNLVVEQIDPSGAVSFFHHDQLGSTRALTDTTGAVVATSAFDAYGKPTSTTGSVTTPFGFAGEYTDAETGFVYLRARYYDPGTGQFISRDPIEALTRSAYNYVDGNPLNATDPLGLKPMWQKIKGGLDVAAVALSGGALIADMFPGGQLVGAVLGGASASVSLSAAGLQCVAGGLNAECAKSAAIGLLSAATFGTSLAASKYLEELPEAEKAARMAFRSIQYTVDAIGYLISGGTTQWSDLAGAVTFQTVAFSTACP